MHPMLEHKRHHPENTLLSVTYKTGYFTQLRCNAFASSRKLFRRTMSPPLNHGKGAPAGWLTHVRHGIASVCVKWMVSSPHLRVTPLVSAFPCSDVDHCSSKPDALVLKTRVLLRKDSGRALFCERRQYVGIFRHAKRLCCFPNFLARCHRWGGRRSGYHTAGRAAQGDQKNGRAALVSERQVHK